MVGKVSKTLDVFALFANIFLLVLLVIVLIGSLNSWSDLFILSIVNNVSLSDRLFSVSIMIVIVTVLGQWIEGRTKEIIRLIKLMRKGGSNGRRRKKIK